MTLRRNAPLLFASRSFPICLSISRAHLRTIICFPGFVQVSMRLRIEAPYQGVMLAAHTFACPAPRPPLCRNHHLLYSICRIPARYFHHSYWKQSQHISVDFAHKRQLSRIQYSICKEIISSRNVKQAITFTVSFLSVSSVRTTKITKKPRSRPIGRFDPLSVAGFINQTKTEDRG